jgi:hypothetical protein
MMGGGDPAKLSTGQAGEYGQRDGAAPRDSGL